MYRAYVQNFKTYVISNTAFLEMKCQLDYVKQENK